MKLHPQRCPFCRCIHRFRCRGQHESPPVRRDPCPPVVVVGLQNTESRVDGTDLDVSIRHASLQPQEPAVRMLTRLHGSLTTELVVGHFETLHRSSRHNYEETLLHLKGWICSICSIAYSHTKSVGKVSHYK